MTLDQRKVVVCDAAARFDTALTPSEQAILLAEANSSDPRQAELVKRALPLALARENFARACSGESFGDPLRLRDQILYGPIEEAYPDASPTFQAVTRSFLTFWREYLDIAHDSPRTFLHAVVSTAIGNHKKYFFPAINIRTAAPHHTFAKPQRRLLEEFGQGIDIDDFFRSNPLLVKTINPLKGSGCCIFILALGSVGILALCVLVS